MNKNRHFQFILLVIFGFFLMGSLEAQDAKSKKWTIDNCVNQFSFEDTVSTKVGYQYWFADKGFLDGRTLKLSVVEPLSATHAPHIHLEDEFFFLLEGKAMFILGNDSVVAEPYASFYCPSGVKHGIQNAGNTQLKYLVIKNYILDKK